MEYLDTLSNMESEVMRLCIVDLEWWQKNSVYFILSQNLSRRIEENCINRLLLTRFKLDIYCIQVCCTDTQPASKTAPYNFSDQAKNNIQSKCSYLKEKGDLKHDI